MTGTILYGTALALLLCACLLAMASAFVSGRCGVNIARFASYVSYLGLGTLIASFFFRN